MRYARHLSCMHHHCRLCCFNTRPTGPSLSSHSLRTASPCSTACQEDVRVSAAPCQCNRLPKQYSCQPLSAVIPQPSNRAGGQLFPSQPCFRCWACHIAHPHQTAPGRRKQQLVRNTTALRRHPGRGLAVWGAMCVRVEPWPPALQDAQGSTACCTGQRRHQGSGTGRPCHV